MLNIVVVKTGEMIDRMIRPGVALNQAKLHGFGSDILAGHVWLYTGKLTKVRFAGR